MNPRLIAIAGPLEGAFFALPEEGVSIGREASNLLMIDSSSVDGRHCLIEARQGQHWIRNLSRPGKTLVNGLPVEERVLAHGDEIRIGECLFLFLTYESETPPVVTLQRYLERLGREERQQPAGVSLRHEMVSESPAMRLVYRFISRVAPSDSTALIRGESGTGKELVARAIHGNSRRAGKPFIAINCAAIAETLLESELFGHEKGAFTGAILQKKGKRELADGGTVFLDEIAELAPVLQAKLLRVLQGHEFERVGGTRPVRVDIRSLAATNKDLEAAVRQGSFRQDLYYRLNVVSLRVPPLRERREDIVPLAEHFAGRFARKAQREVLGLTPEALDLLTDYDWPGNVRELENAIERAVVLGATEFIMPEDLAKAVMGAERKPGEASNGYHGAVKEAKRRLVLKAIKAAGGNYTEAARSLGIHPNNLHRLIRTLELRGELGRAGHGGTSSR